MRDSHVGHTPAILFDFAISPTRHIVQELSKWQLIKRDLNHPFTSVLGVFWIKNVSIKIFIIR